jgi:WNK lysine deficient protein kinase
MHSGKYSAIIYSSGNEAEADSSPRPREAQAQPVSHKSIRFGENCRDSHLPSEQHKQCRTSPDASMGGASTSRGRQPAFERHCMMRNRSMVDIRSQLLHKTLVHELNKRLFKTVGSVENIGFQNPYQDSSSSQREGSPLRDERKNGECWF